MFLTATIRTDEGKAIEILVLKEKVFKSGRTGWFGQKKIEIDGQRYQAQAQLVAIAAKDRTQKKARTISMTDDEG